MNEVKCRFSKSRFSEADGRLTVIESEMSLTGEGYDFLVDGEVIQKYDDREYPEWAWEAAKSWVKNND